MFRFVSVSLLAAGAAMAANAAPCDRACLKTMLDQYLNAVVQHNPSAAPLSIGYRQTENANVRRPGTGEWQNAKALGKLQRRYFDPVTEQAGYFGTFDDNGGTAIVTVRIKVEDRKITEGEWLISHKGDPGYGEGAGAQAAAAFNDVPNLLAHPPAERVVAKSERLSRTDLIAITNSYFDALMAHDGTLMIAQPGCVRLENGYATTQTKQPDGTLTDCASNGAMRNIFAVTDRRYPLVDEEANVVLAIGVFLRKPGVAMKRNLFSEWFYIDGGKIHGVYSSMMYPEQDAMVPNWPPYDGNWPIAAPPK